jgi:signal transduction histidine kinase
VVLDVRDDGEGFAPGAVADRADLTGGQGLIALRRRAESLGGYLTVESTPGQGSAISIQLPTGVA